MITHIRTVYEPYDVYAYVSTYMCIDTTTAHFVLHIPELKLY